MSSRRSRDAKTSALNTSSGEDAALDSIARRAEEMLQEKRKERERARRIRLQEIEKKQREEEEQMDKKYEMDKTPAYSRLNQYTGSNSAPTHASTSRRSSIDSADSNEASGKDFKVLYNELDEKYRRSMMTNAQLDNEKQALLYQVEEIKDRLEDIEEGKHCVDRELKDKHRQLEAEKRKQKAIECKADRLKMMVEQRDELLKEHKLIMVEPTEPQLQENGYDSDEVEPIRAALLSEELAIILRAMDGTLEDKIRSLLNENSKLKASLKTAKETLEEEREKANQRPQRKPDPQMNGGELQSPQVIEMQRESAKQISDYKLKMQKAELDIASLESSVARLETQVRRYKQMADDSEKVEDELKSEKRKIQRELREAQQQIEELETQKSHLQNRLDRIRQARKEVLGTAAEAT